METKKSHLLRQHFNFWKELKRLHKKQKIPKQNRENCTLIGYHHKKEVYISDNCKHCFICGTTGSGKTVSLANFIKHATNRHFPVLLVDGKGDLGSGSLLEITKQFAVNQKLYIINLSDPLHSDKYNPFRNASPTICKDMLINLTEWSEEHYKLNTERYLQKLVIMLSQAKIPLSLKTIIKYIPVEHFNKLSLELVKTEIITKQEHALNIEVSKLCGKIAESACARFSTIAESELGIIFDENGIDIYTAIQENAIILFILNPLLYPEISPLMGRLILIDAKKAVSKCFGTDLERAFFIFDEINTYASTALIDLINKSRSANITSILATQSLSDLDFSCGEAFKEQVIENINNYIVLRQNSAVNAEHWANILGTRETIEVTYQIEQQARNTNTTGLGSAKRVREFLYHPDDIKALKTGRGFFLSRDDNIHCSVVINKPF